MDINTIQTLSGETLLTELQQECVRKGVSDIHISPEKTDVRLEWRLHGVLTLLARISRPNFEEMLRRIKFMAKLKLNISNVPQDGQYTFPFDKRIVNVRVATIPSRFGEAITLRLLDPEHGIIPLVRLGFPASIEAELKRMIDLPNGLILVTGPTGSGKTTTLYALLSTIIGKERNIITLEDPVEYELPGIIQSEIDTDHDYNFNNGLRSILRHDPDVILVGEIRDLETAQTAVNASLTGHIVLSTLHTNSAIESIQRMLSMGVSPYTLAPALRGVLAQRLVRTLKKECRAEGSNCDLGSNDSYDGQIVVPELLVVNQPIQQAILDFQSSAAILELARKDGYRTMREWGDDLLKERITTKEEVERVSV